MTFVRSDSIVNFKRKRMETHVSESEYSVFAILSKDRFIKVNYNCVSK